MATGTRPLIGNEQFSEVIYVAAITYPTLAANASNTNTLTVQGVQVGDLISWNVQAPPAHIFMENVYVSAVNTFTITWTTDGTGIATGSLAALFEIARPENGTMGVANLPPNVV